MPAISTLYRSLLVKEPRSDTRGDGWALDALGVDAECRRPTSQPLAAVAVVALRRARLRPMVRVAHHRERRV